MAHLYLHQPTPPLAQSTNTEPNKYLDQVVDAARNHASWGPRVARSTATEADSEKTEPSKREIVHVNSGVTQISWPATHLSSLSKRPGKSLGVAAWNRGYGVWRSRGVSSLTSWGCGDGHNRSPRGEVMNAIKHHPYDDEQASRVTESESFSFSGSSELMPSLERPRKHLEAQWPHPLPSAVFPISNTVASVDFSFSQRFLIDYETRSRHDLIVDFFLSYPTVPRALFSRSSLLHHSKSCHAGDIAARDSPMRKPSPRTTFLPSIINRQSVTALNEADESIVPRSTSAGQWHRFRVAFPGALWSSVIRHQRQLLIRSLKRDIEAVLLTDVAIDVYSLCATAVEMELIVDLKQSRARSLEIADALSHSPFAEVWAVYSVITLFLTEEAPLAPLKPSLSSPTFGKNSVPVFSAVTDSAVGKAITTQQAERGSTSPPPSWPHVNQWDTTSSTRSSKSNSRRTTTSLTVHGMLKMTIPLLFPEEDTAALQRLIDKAPSKLRSALCRDAVDAMPLVEVQIHSWKAQPHGLYVELLVCCADDGDIGVTDIVDMAFKRSPFANTWCLIRASRKGLEIRSLALPMIVKSGNSLPETVSPSNTRDASVPTFCLAVPTAPLTAEQSGELSSRSRYLHKGKKTVTTSLLPIAAQGESSDHESNGRITESTVDTVNNRAARSDFGFLAATSLLSADSLSVLAGNDTATPSHEPSVRSRKRKTSTSASAEVLPKLVSANTQVHVKEPTRGSSETPNNLAQPSLSLTVASGVENTSPFSASSLPSSTLLPPLQVYPQREDSHVIIDRLEHQLQSVTESIEHLCTASAASPNANESAQAQVFDLVTTEEKDNDNNRMEESMLLSPRLQSSSSTLHSSGHPEAVREEPHVSRVPSEAEKQSASSLTTGIDAQSSAKQVEVAPSALSDSVEASQPRIIPEKQQRTDLSVVIPNTPLSRVSLNQLSRTERVQRYLRLREWRPSTAVPRMIRVEDPVSRCSSAPIQGTMGVSTKLVVVREPEVLRSLSESSLSQAAEHISHCRLLRPGTQWERLIMHHGDAVKEAVVNDIKELLGSTASEMATHTISVGDNGSLEVQLSVPSTMLPLEMSPEEFLVAAEQLPLKHLRELHETAEAGATTRFHFRRFFSLEGLTEERLAGAMESVRSLFLADTCAALDTLDDVVENLELSGYLIVDATVRAPSNCDNAECRSMLLRYGYPQLNALLRDLAAAGTPTTTSLSEEGAECNSITVSAVLPSSTSDTAAKGASCTGVDSDVIEGSSCIFPAASQLSGNRTGESPTFDMTTESIACVGSTRSSEQLLSVDESFPTFHVQENSTVPSHVKKKSVCLNSLRSSLSLYRSFFCVPKSANVTKDSDATCTLHLRGVMWRQLLKRGYSDLIRETFEKEALQCLRHDDHTAVMLSVSVKKLGIKEDGLVIGYNVGSKMGNSRIDSTRAQETIAEFAFPQLWEVYHSFVPTHNLSEPTEDVHGAASQLLSRFDTASSVGTPKEPEDSPAVPAEEVQLNTFETHPEGSRSPLHPSPTLSHNSGQLQGGGSKNGRSDSQQAADGEFAHRHEKQTQRYSATSLAETIHKQLEAAENPTLVESSESIKYNAGSPSEYEGTGCSTHALSSLQWPSTAGVDNTDLAPAIMTTVSESDSRVLVKHTSERVPRSPSGSGIVDDGGAVFPKLAATVEEGDHSHHQVARSYFGTSGLPFLNVHSAVPITLLDVRIATPDAIPMVGHLQSAAHQHQSASAVDHADQQESQLQKRASQVSAALRPLSSWPASTVNNHSVQMFTQESSPHHIDDVSKQASVTSSSLIPAPPKAASSSQGTPSFLIVVAAQSSSILNEISIHLDSAKVLISTGYSRIEEELTLETLSVVPPNL